MSLRTINHTLDDLLDDSLFEIFLCLPPEDISHVSKVNRRLAKLTSERLLWKIKLFVHFPDLAHELTSDTQHDCRQLFAKKYHEAFTKKDIEFRRLISFAKEGMLPDIKSIFPRGENFSLRLLASIKDCADNNGMSVFDWIRKNKHQAIFDYFYLLAEGYFLQPHIELPSWLGIQLPDKHFKLFYWAIICDQAVAQTMAQYHLRYRDAIHIAAQHGRDDLIKLWINADDTLRDIADRNGYKPLDYALKRRQTSTALLLIDSTSAYSMQDALLKAIKNKHVDVAIFLMNHPALQGFLTGLHNYIHEAAKMGLPTVIKEFLSLNPALVNHRDGEQFTPLHYAAQYNNIDCMDLLIKHGATIDAVAGPGPLTTMFFPIFKGLDEAFILLIKHGAAIHRVDKQVSTSSHKIRSLLSLIEYIDKREHASETYVSSFKLFGRTMIFGQTRQAELAAAQALKAIILNNESTTSLAVHIVNTIRNDRLLNDIYQWWLGLECNNKQIELGY